MGQTSRLRRRAARGRATTTRGGSGSPRAARTPFARFVVNCRTSPAAPRAPISSESRVDRRHEAATSRAQGEPVRLQCRVSLVSSQWRRGRGCDDVCGASSRASEALQGRSATRQVKDAARAGAVRGAGAAGDGGRRRWRIVRRGGLRVRRRCAAGLPRRGPAPPASVARGSALPVSTDF